MCGENFPLDNDNRILEIWSPRRSVEGPHIVVFKNLDERWAIVAMDWDREPRIGIRWFWGNSGHPSARGYPTWFVVPPSLSQSILSGLSPLGREFSGRLKKYLTGRMSGSDLAQACR